MRRSAWMLLCSVVVSTACGDKGSKESAQSTPKESTKPAQTSPSGTQPDKDAGTSAGKQAPSPSTSSSSNAGGGAGASGKPAGGSGPAAEGGKRAEPTTPAQGSGEGCTARAIGGPAGVHFHHVHFNTTDAEADRAFFTKFFGAQPIDFCKDASGKVLSKATMTERGYFLYTQVPEPADPKLNTYLEHVGWIHPDPAAELQRLVALDVPLFPVGRAQCDSAFAGTAPCSNYWFYLLAPSGARIEVARGPGPAKNGFGHVHFVQGEDYSFFEKISGGTFMNKAIDDVNHTDAALVESVLSMEMVTETRGKPIDHIGYSTTTLEAERDRIKADGIHIEEDISFKADFGFRSFFVKSPKGIWVEILEDSRFGM